MTLSIPALAILVHLATPGQYSCFTNREHTSSPEGNLALRSLITNGLIEENHEEAGSPFYTITPRGEAFLAALTNTPLPVKKETWAMT